jgi:hypothetical protein
MEREYLVGLWLYLLLLPEDQPKVVPIRRSLFCEITYNKEPRENNANKIFVSRN